MLVLYSAHLVLRSPLNQHSSQLSERAVCAAAAPMHDFVQFALENAWVAAFIHDFVHLLVRTRVLLLPLTVRPDTAHNNVAWQGTGMEVLVCSTVLLLLPTYHTTQTTHLPHVWLFIHVDTMCFSVFADKPGLGEPWFLTQPCRQILLQSTPRVSIPPGRAPLRPAPGLLALSTPLPVSSSHQHCSKLLMRQCVPPKQPLKKKPHGGTLSW